MYINNNKLTSHFVKDKLLNDVPFRKHKVSHINHHNTVACILNSEFNIIIIIH